MGSLPLTFGGLGRRRHGDCVQGAAITVRPSSLSNWARCTPNTAGRGMRQARLGCRRRRTPSLPLSRALSLTLSPSVSRASRPLPSLGIASFVDRARGSAFGARERVGRRSAREGQTPPQSLAVSLRAVRVCVLRRICDVNATATRGARLLCSENQKQCMAVSSKQVHKNVNVVCASPRREDGTTRHAEKPCPSRPPRIATPTTGKYSTVLCARALDSSKQRPMSKRKTLTARVIHFAEKRRWT